ncbi:putative ribokinase NDAI_0A00710 [Naumovozyma dairenensis CBS 421]|uniref:Ribokinase n=1 Tax=Naumovozyma dairenensis (strain ATCC 10597 / BCRC 20456 / CBS 421 / NBRC 0211 / NRRL Y-12639) TaxID=1071378 RepID=G0W341_NAUDC|nr:hypothetical protein NDAI_0A00710 [Naumovozyma dairenensis CBS 421]CCD22229.1 hypothetical protein NDAI_0A00710 [Naumovozyma dairenensis CBS 421]
MGITIVGSLNYDLVTYTDRVPDSGETFRANHFETHAGGKGLNQTIATARMKDPKANYKVKMVGNVGKDSFGEQLLDILRKNNVDVANVGILPNVMTGIATILVEQKDGSGQNRIIITQGANGKSTYESGKLENIFPTDSSDRKQMVIFQQEIPNPTSIIHWLNKNRPTYEIVFNPSPFEPISAEDWHLVDVLIVNEVEAVQILETIYNNEEIKNYKSAIEKDFVEGYEKICSVLQKTLVSQSKSAIVVTTLGSKGALFCSKDHPTVGFVPSCKVDSIVDTTGAGDTFLGSLVTQLYQGQDLEKAMKFSTVASSLSIQKRGAAESMPTFEDVQSSF